MADCCRNESVVYVPYSNKHYCEKHFLDMFDKRFRKTIREFSLLKKGERIAVGLSGGKDSCALLHSLKNMSLPLELVAITIDEGIDGYRNRTLETAKRECKKLGIEHKVFSFKKEKGKTLDEIMSEKKDDIPCSHCGVIRRYLLNKAAREVDAEKLALGHNLDDVAQTVMMNIMRNEPSRLARFNTPLVTSSRFVQRIRPFIRTPEKEIAIYCMLKGIELDRDDCPYARFALRANVRSMLNTMEEKYPGTKYKVLNSFLEMEDALVAKYSKNAAINHCVSCGEPCSADVCKFCKID